MVQRFIQSNAFFISACILILWSIVCTRVPLFNYLGFEFSSLTAVVAGYVSGVLTLALWRATHVEITANMWSVIGKTALVQFVLLILPFLISLANALFVKNCSLDSGTMLYALIVIPGVLFSMSLSLFIWAIFEKWRKTLFSILYILVLLHIPLVTLLRPQIFAFNPIIGFFPGFAYDETLQVTQKLLIYRLTTLAATGCICASVVWICQIRYRKKELSRSSQHSIPIYEITLLAFLGPIVLMIFSFSDRLGFSSSEEFIRQKLAGNYKTTHFEIIYPAGSIKRERIEQLGRVHEFYFQKFSQELNLHPQECIRSFIYASLEQKGRFIGTARTDIAKPWLRQMHMNLENVESALKHELVHILATEFGWSPLKIAPNSGLIEGLAVALNRTMMDEPLDRAAALALAAGVNPNLESLFTLTGFAQMSSSVGYTLAGSFCRSLIDSFGVEKFKYLYQTGDFNRIYQQNLKSLLMAWKTSIKNIPLDSMDSLKAAYFFRRPSIFGKECVRVIANVNTETREFLTQREFEKALLSVERSLVLSWTSEAIFQKTTALFELRRFRDVVNLMKPQLYDTLHGYALLPLHLRLGDAYWAMDSLIQAKQEYETMASIHLGAWYEEACALRLEALKTVQECKELQILFVYSMEDTTRIARLGRLASPIARYLLAREYSAKEHFIECTQILESLGPMQSKMLEFFRLYRLGKSWFELQNYEKARTVFEHALQIIPNTYLKMETEEWLERCKFWSRQLSQGS